MDFSYRRFANTKKSTMKMRRATMMMMARIIITNKYSSSLPSILSIFGALVVVVVVLVVSAGGTNGSFPSAAEVMAQFVWTNSKIQVYWKGYKIKNFQGNTRDFLRRKSHFVPSICIVCLLQQINAIPPRVVFFWGFILPSDYCGKKYAPIKLYSEKTDFEFFSMTFCFMSHAENVTIYLM